MIRQDIPLIGFTLLSQLSVGALILYNLIVYLPTYRNKTHLPSQFKTIPVLVFTFAVISVMFSVFHMGRPLKALNTLDNLSSSWLSREILMIITYLLLSGLFTLFLFIKSEWKRLGLVLLNLATVSGIVLIFTMSRIYSSLPIPVWQPIFTFLNFVATTLALGGGLMLIMQIQIGSLSGQQSLAWILGIVLLLEIIFIPIFLSYLDQNSTASQLSLKLLLKDFTLFFYLRLGFQILSIGSISLAIIGIRSNTAEFKKLFWPVIGATCFIFLNEIMGRILFYAIEVPFGSM